MHPASISWAPTCTTMCRFPSCAVAQLHLSILPGPRARPAQSSRPPLANLANLWPSLVHHSNGPPGLAPTSGQSQARQKIRFHSLSGSDSAVIPACAHSGPVQSAKSSLNIKMHFPVLSSIQLFTSLLSLRCPLAALLLSAGRQCPFPTNQVPPKLFRSKLSLLATSPAIRQIHRNTQLWRKFIANSSQPWRFSKCEKLQDCRAVQFWSSLNVCLIFIAVISTAVTENVYEELGVWTAKLQYHNKYWYWCNTIINKRIYWNNSVLFSFLRNSFCSNNCISMNSGDSLLKRGGYTDFIDRIFFANPHSLITLKVLFLHNLWRYVRVKSSKGLGRRYASLGGMQDCK